MKSFDSKISNHRFHQNIISIVEWFLKERTLNTGVMASENFAFTILFLLFFLISVIWNCNVLYFMNYLYVLFMFLPYFFNQINAAMVSIRDFIQKRKKSHDHRLLHGRVHDISKLRIFYANLIILYNFWSHVRSVTFTNPLFFLWRAILM